MLNEKNRQEMESREPLLEMRGVSKTFAGPAGEFAALKNIHLQVRPGEFVAVVGKSGSGKSTLLHLFAGIDRPTSGEILAGGREVHRMDQEEVTVWRGRTMGVVFQFFQLLPTLTVLENVMLPMDFCSYLPSRERKGRALQLLERFGIADQARKLPAHLSGGQQQRAAMARALANDPPILVADEPTGNLDSHTAELILQLFRDLAGDGKTIVMVTHEREIKRWAGRSVTLADGEIVNDLLSTAGGREDATTLG